MTKLTIGERITLLGILPKQANILIIRRVEELAKKLQPSNNEIKKFEIKVGEGQITWNDPNYTIEIEIGEIMSEEIKKILKQMSEENKLGREHIGLYDKFMEEKKEEEKK
jgi:hypothetical protein